VYGIFGLLSSDLRTYLPVDYSLTLTQVYQKAVMACVAERGDLSILCYARLPPESDLVTTSAFGYDQFMHYIQSVRTETAQPKELTRWSCWTSRVALHSHHEDLDYQKFSDKSHVTREPRLRGLGWTLATLWEAIIGTNQSREVFTLRSAVEVIADIQPTNQLLYGLRVRAHFIDDVNEKSRTRYALVNNSRLGDEIFAFDGVPRPLLLRQVRPNQYRILGTCDLPFDQYLLICNTEQLTDQKLESTLHTQCVYTQIIEVY
jgi:hypothetical protein